MVFESAAINLTAISVTGQGSTGTLQMQQGSELGGVYIVDKD
jgi:hypothetical protein